MNTTKAITAIHDHIANNTPIDDDALKTYAPLFATDLHARDAIIMCALRPDDADLEQVLGFALHPHEETLANNQKRILEAVMSGDLPIHAESFNRAISLFARMRDLDDTPGHYNPFTATLMYFAWFADDMQTLAKHIDELDEGESTPSLAQIVLLALSKGMRVKAEMD